MNRFWVVTESTGELVWVGNGVLPAVWDFDVPGFGFSQGQMLVSYSPICWLDPTGIAAAERRPAGESQNVDARYEYAETVRNQPLVVRWYPDFTDALPFFKEQLTVDEFDGLIKEFV